MQPAGDAGTVVPGWQGRHDGTATEICLSSADGLQGVPRRLPFATMLWAVVTGQTSRRHGSRCAAHRRRSRMTG